MTDTPAIEAEGLVKRYDGVRALDGLTLSVDRGEFFGLLGPNGAGKTTFIETLVGLVEPTAGQAAVFGNDVETEQQAVRNHVSVAPQEFNVDRFFPIQEVLEHAARMHGVRASDARERAAEALASVGLAARGDRKFRALSGGMKRRFLLARALVSEPDLLILDEPTAGVDVELRRDIWDVVQGLNEDGMTILLTTHYIEEAERLCDRVCVVDGGQTVVVDTPGQLRRRGTDTIRVGISGQRVRANQLRAVDGVDDVAVTSDGVTVRAERAESVLAAVVTAVSRQGRTIETLEVDRASLEDAFVELTGPGADGSGGPESDEPAADRPSERSRQSSPTEQ